MFKILSLSLAILFGGCAVTGQPADRHIVVKKQNTQTANKKVKKLTDSKNKEDDSFFEFILTKIDKAITYIIKDKTPDKKEK